MKRNATAILFLMLTTVQPSFGYNRESAIGVSVASLLIWNPMKLSAVGLDYGEDEQFKRTRLLLNWQLKSLPRQYGPISLNGHLELAAGQTQPAPQNVSIGLTPILEWSYNANQFTPFIETGLGINYLTRSEQLERELSTNFQFGETLGIGARYKNIQLSARYQHLSNGDIVKPNNGYNFYGVMFKYWY